MKIIVISRKLSKYEDKQRQSATTHLLTKEGRGEAGKEIVDFIELLTISKIYHVLPT